MTPPTLAEIQQWPAVVPLWASSGPAAGRVFGLSRTQTYDLARRDEFPCRVLHIGKLLKCSTAQLMTALGMPLNPANDKGPDSPDSAGALIAHTNTSDQRIFNA